MSRRTLASFLALAIARTAAADEPTEPERAVDDAPAASPTSTKLERRDLDHRPHLRPIDLLRHVPGLAVLGQGAQAPHFLVRGFDAGHGAGLGVTVDGVPINIGSHAYAHGYADTSFIIPDTIASVALYEGAYAARYGAETVAGHLDLRTIDRVPGAVVRLTSGIDLTAPRWHDRLQRLRYRMTGMFSPDVERGSALLAAEVGLEDGPFVHPQRLRRAAMLGKWKRPIGGGVLGVTLQFYSGRWFDSGLLPAREIERGRLTPFSAADPTQGGIALRTSASITYEVRDRRGATWHLSGHVVDSDLRLYTNPTLFARDATYGDEIEYVDSRLYYGFDGYYRRRHRWGPVHGHVRVGVQARADHADTTTWHDARRLRLVECFGATNPCTDLAPQTRKIGVYVEDRLAIGRWVRAIAGVRLDQEIWNVDDRDGDTMLGATSLGGTGARARISPKLGVMLRSGAAELWVLGGAGSHATDARASVDRSGYGSFVRTYTGEVGARVRPREQIAAAVSASTSRLAEHQLWAPALGISVRAPASSRFGLDARFAFTPTRWLSLDAALSIARGVLAPEAMPAALLPLAPRFVAHAGAVARSDASFASLRLRALGPRATTDESLQADGHTLIDLVAGHRWRVFELGLAIENLLDSRWREVQRAGDVRPSRRVDIARDLLITTGMPLTFMVTLGYVP